MFFNFCWLLLLAWWGQSSFLQTSGRTEEGKYGGHITSVEHLREPDSLVEGAQNR